MASFGFSRSIKVPRSDAAVRCILHADPRAIRHALPSLLIEPSGSNEIRFVSGPLNLAKRVISLAITTHLRRASAGLAADARTIPVRALARLGARR